MNKIKTKLLTLSTFGFLFFTASCQILTPSENLRENKDHEIFLVRAESDYNDQGFDIQGVLNDAGDLGEIRYHGGDRDYQLVLADLADGQTMFEFSGVPVAILFSDNYSPQTGGHFRIQYSYNFITGSYRNFEFDVVRSGNDWALYTSEEMPRVFTLLFLRTHRIFGQPVGVSSVEPR